MISYVFPHMFACSAVSNSSYFVLKTLYDFYEKVNDHFKDANVFLLLYLTYGFTMYLPTCSSCFTMFLTGRQGRILNVTLSPSINMLNK